MSRPVSKVTRAPVTGPLAAYARTLRAGLRASGYTPLSTVNTMRLVAHLSRWLEANGLGVSDLDGGLARRDAAARGAGGRTSARLARRLAPGRAVRPRAGAAA